MRDQRESFEALLFGADALLELTEIGIEPIPLPELYEGVTLPEPSTGDEG